MAFCLCLVQLLKEESAEFVTFLSSFFGNLLASFNDKARPQIFKEFHAVFVDDGELSARVADVIELDPTERKKNISFLAP